MALLGHRLVDLIRHRFDFIEREIRIDLSYRVANHTDHGSWTPAVNLGDGVNTRWTEYCPVVSRDGRYLFFTSERPGIVFEIPEGAKDPGDIYMIDLTAVITR